MDTIKRLNLNNSRDYITEIGLPIPPQIDTTDLYSEWEGIKSKYGGLSNVPYTLLGEFLDKWSSLISYTKWVEAQVDVEQATAREIRDTLKKQLYAIKDGSRELRDALCYTDDEYIKSETDYVNALTKLILIQGLREGYEQKLNAISRELTRRTEELRTDYKI